MNDGGQAFPRTEGESHSGNLGMTLRDYFAAKIMVGLLSSMDANSTKYLDKQIDPDGFLCAVSFKIADAMLKARQK